MNSIELWKDIPNYEGLYLISSLGRVKSFYNNHAQLRNTPKILKPFKLSKGYLGISLSDSNHISKTYKVHRLVAESFIENPNNYPMVNHKNEIKTDNTVENLEWCTNQYNLLYGSARDRINNTNALNGHYVTKKIAKMTLDGNILKVYKSAGEACKDNNISSKYGILSCCKNKPGYRTANGYKWKFI